MCALSPSPRISALGSGLALLLLPLTFLVPPERASGQDRPIWVETAYQTIIADLNQFLADQEAYFEVYDEYSTDLASLGCSTSPGVTLAVTAGLWGFTAVGRHESLGTEYGCTVYLGDMDPPKSPASPRNPGAVDCSRGYPPSPLAEPLAWPNLVEGPSYVAYDVAPSMKNPKGFARRMKMEYPRDLLHRMVGGTTMVSAFVCEGGSVRAIVVAQSSGYEERDQAARRVAKAIEFHPATRDGSPVGVWVTLPIRFAAR